MKLELHEMVRAVELTLNFGAEEAAEIEYVSRQSIYYRIRKLEEITQIQFFDRHHHWYCELTEAGKEWLGNYNSVY